MSIKKAPWIFQGALVQYDISTTYGLPHSSIPGNILHIPTTTATTTHCVWLIGDNEKMVYCYHFFPLVFIKQAFV